MCSSESEKLFLKMKHLYSEMALGKKEAILNPHQILTRAEPAALEWACLIMDLHRNLAPFISEESFDAILRQIFTRDLTYNDLKEVLKNAKTA